MKKIIYEKTDKSISIIIPTENISIKEVFEKDIPEEYKDKAKIIEDNIIPADRIFRNAWELENKKIVINIDKAKEIWKDKLRQERIPLLENLDIEWMIATEKKQDTKLISDKKNILRNITDLVDNCKTINDIKNINCENQLSKL